MFYISAEKFFDFALKLFAKAGHIDAVEPEFKNHSAKQFVYFDCDKNFFLSEKQRKSINFFDNISRLFTFQEIAIFSLSLTAPKNERSQAAHDVNLLIQFCVNEKATICLSQHGEEIIFSFAGYDWSCFLSDWYSSEEEILKRLDISNMAVTDGREYFCDFIDAFARKYYFSGSVPTFYDLVPINFFTDFKLSNTHIELEEILIDKKFSFVKDYGDDYVEYDKFLPKDVEDNELELDLILQEAENIQLNLDFDEEDLSETESTSDDSAEIDAEILDDPELLFDYIQKNYN